MWWTANIARTRLVRHGWQTRATLARRFVNEEAIEIVSVNKRMFINDVMNQAQIEKQLPQRYRLFNAERIMLAGAVDKLAPHAAEWILLTAPFARFDHDAAAAAHPGNEPIQVDGLHECGIALIAEIQKVVGERLFVQSRVPAHSELAYLLECTATTGELNRMIQFKEKGRGRDGTRASLFTYPALMAADILLYRPDRVPVGDDQRQHVELTRDLAIRFNNTYGPVFTVPEIVTPSTAARIMDLARPTEKMGKSHADGSGIVYLLDPQIGHAAHIPQHP